MMRWYNSVSFPFSSSRMKFDGSGLVLGNCYLLLGTYMKNMSCVPCSQSVVK
jgi:hypothetical protein